MSSVIHPTAIVEPGAILGDGCVIHPGAIIKACAELGDGCIVHPYAVVGGDPQALRFDMATPTRVKVGARTTIREYVTINRSLKVDAPTIVGSDCLLMACSHVAHDCVLGDKIVVANAVLLAGHVHVANNVILGGASAYHQFSRIGEGAMVGGTSRITLDVPPFTIVVERTELVGLNLIGLKRRGCSRDTIKEIKAAFREVYSTPGNIREIAAAMLARGSFQSAEAKLFLEFFTQGDRGIARPRKKGAASDEADEG